MASGFFKPSRALVLVLMATSAGAVVLAQQVSPAVEGLEVLKVQGNVYMLAGAGGNVAVQVGDEGVLVVDTGLEASAAKVLAAIKKLAGDKPIRFVVNTHVHTDHTGGNATIKAAGQDIIAGNVALDVGGDRATGAAIIAHENVLNRMSAPTGSQSPTPSSAWPTETFFNDENDLFFNDEPVQIFAQPSAHTDGDAMVFFRKSDVLATGDVFVTTSYPVIDVPRGGSINGILAGLNHIIDITVPRDKQEGGTMVIPGHGRICDEADVVDYRDMVTIIRDRIQKMVKDGMTLDRVKAARPTRDYDGRYGATAGNWTTDMFVEAVYRTLSPPAPAAPRR
jgi:glyoxylase-like metal-dependent hydrolase (beta-lactamase superfamily II)